MAKDVWSQRCRKIQKRSLNCFSFQGIWDYLVTHLNQKELMEVAMIVRLLWFRRNEFVHGKGFMDPNLLIEKAKRKLELYGNIQTYIDPGRGRGSQHSNVSWVKPPPGMYKFN